MEKGSFFMLDSDPQHCIERKNVLKVSRSYKRVGLKNKYIHTHILTPRDARKKEKEHRRLKMKLESLIQQQKEIKNKTQEIEMNRQVRY